MFKERTISNRRELLEPIFILENVSEFGLEEAQKCLGDLYEIERVLANSNDEGWRSSRLRQFLVGRGRFLTPPIINSAILGEYTVFLSVGSIIRCFFTRVCAFTQEEYKIATPEEIANDLIWAASRPHVLLRYGPLGRALAALPKQHVPFRVID